MAQERTVCSWHVLYRDTHGVDVVEADNVTHDDGFFKLWLKDEVVFVAPTGIVVRVGRSDAMHS